MTTYEAVMAIEQPETHDFTEQVEAMQSLIDSGVVWQLQGSYGRLAASMIATGMCRPAPTREAR